MSAFEKVKEFNDKGWSIRSVAKGCLSSKELEEWEEKMAPLVALPEMLFGNNRLTMVHRASGIQIEFNAFDALSLVNKNECDVELVYSEAWQKSRTASGEQETIEHLKSKAKPYDWTFTAPYFSSIRRKAVEKQGGQADEENEAGAEDDAAKAEEARVESEVKIAACGEGEDIDYERLKRPDPILYFDEVMLWEDELADNGSSDLRVKIRVMPSCFFVLLRLFIRVDHVMFRVIDTRLYHEFGAATVLRDVQRREATYKELGARLPRDPTKLADMQHMVGLLPLVPEKCRREKIFLK